MERFLDPADPIWERRIRSFEEPQLPAAAASSAVDPTGATDSTAGLQNALQQAANEKRTLFVPPGEYKIGANGKGLDFSKIKYPGGTPANKEIINCDPAATFTGSSALKIPNEPVVKISPPAEGEEQFISCRFKFGKVNAAAKETNLVNVLVQGCNDSIFEFVALALSSRGLKLEHTTTKFCANNLFWIGACNLNLIGIQLLSTEVEGAGVGIQSNQFHAGEIGSNGTGIQVDNATGKNSRWNSFYVGTLDGNLRGIEDFTGTTKYYIGVASGNTEYDFKWSKTAKNKPGILLGALEKGVAAETLEGAGIHMVNAEKPPGLAASQQGVPAKNETIHSLQERPATVYVVTTGAETAITQAGKATGLKGAGSFTLKLMPGETISLGNYTTAEWVWFLE